MDLPPISTSSNCMAYEIPTKTASIIASVLMTVFLFIGIFGNAWTLWVLFQCNKLRQNLINNLIMSLCANDILNLTCVQSFVLATYFCPQCALGSLSCYFVPEANMILVGCSLWHHAFIAMHRYLVVVQWHFYMKIKKHLYLLVVILGSRVFPLMLTLVFNSTSYVKFRALVDDDVENTKIAQIEAFFKSFIFYSPYLLRCIYKRSEKDRIICVLVLTVIQPCVIVLVCFTAIFIHVRRKGLLVQRAFDDKMKTKAIGAPNEKLPIREFVKIQIRINSFESLSLEERSTKPHPLSNSDSHCDARLSTTDTEVSLKPPIGPTTRSASEDLSPGRLKVTRLHKKRSSVRFVFQSFDKKRISKELAITKMFGVVFLLFIAGYLPYGVIRMIDRTNIDPDDCIGPSSNDTNISANHATTEYGTPPDVYVFVSVLYAIASCCNPLIFGVMHRDIRKNAIACLRRLKRHQWTHTRAQHHSR